MGVIPFPKSHGLCFGQDGLLQVIDPAQKNLTKRKKENVLGAYRDDQQNFKKCRRNQLFQSSGTGTRNKIRSISLFISYIMVDSEI